MNLHYVRVKSPPYKYVMSTVREYLFRKLANLRRIKSRQEQLDEGTKQAAAWLKDEYYDL